ncbi:hypothetical protein DB346_18620 [Verrucomicrobia bacterium LW23]|nr:hypothetical protein DB346_18620 [Verrucomicrobia bacterium LW23]
MKIAAHVAAALVCLGMLVASVPLLLGLVTPPPLPEGTPIHHFMQAFGPTGYMTFIKVMELIGAILVAIPLTRNLGLLVVGPILVNILVFKLTVGGGVAQLMDPIFLVIALGSLFILWCERHAWAALVQRPA